MAQLTCTETSRSLVKVIVKDLRLLVLSKPKEFDVDAIDRS